MPAERSALRSIYKNTRTARSGKPCSADLSYDDDDSNVQVTDVKLRKRIKQEDEEELPYRHQRPRLDTNTLIVIDSDSDKENPPTMAPLASASASATVPPWPAGMYVMDMVAGFRQMDSHSLKGLNREERFKCVFGSEVKYHASTFTAQQAKFNKATPTQVKKGVEAGQTTDGLWSV